MNHSNKDVLLYTDCPFFAGCENVISNLLNDDEFTNTFNLHYAYNYSKKYQEGLELKVHKNNFTTIKLYLLNQIVYDRFNILIKLLLIAPSIFYKYFSIIINTIILTNKFKRQKYDILLLNNGGYPGAYSAYSAIFAAKLNNINNIFYIVNNQSQDYKHPSRWVDFLLDKLVIRAVNKFITGSDNSGKRLKKVLGTNDDKLVTINNGVLLPAIKETPFEIKQKYNLPNNKVLALVGANLVKRKGHISLLAAIQKLKMELNEDLPIHFVFAGDGEERNNLINYIKLNDLGNHITMLGHINDIFTLINSTDILILPSISHEDFPYIIIEAMSQAKPIIGTKVAGIPEQIIDDVNGYLIEPSDAYAIKEALLKFVHNPQLIEKFGMESKKIFNEKYQIEIGIHKYIHLLRLNKN